MSEPRHRKPERRRGVTVRTQEGKRRRSGILDESHRTARQLNREARRTAARRARLRVGMALVGASIIVVTSVAFSWLTLRDREDPASVVDGSNDVGSSLLIALTGEDGSIRSLALVATHPEVASRLVLFPPALLTVLPGYGESEIANVIRFEGAGLAATTVSNLLGVRIDAVVSMTAADFANEVGPLTVTLTTPLLVSAGRGFQVVAAEGTAEREAGMIATLITTQGEGDQLAWLDRQGSVWKEAIGRAGDPAVARDIAARAIGDPAGALRALTSAAEDPELVVTAVPAARIERTGGDTELYSLSGEVASAFVDERFAYLRLRSEPRPRVEVLNGNGRIGTTGPIARVLVEAGYRIVRTDNADRDDYAVTQVIAQGREHQVDAIDVRDILGRGEVLLEVRQPSGVVDLTVIVGRDIPA